MPLNLRSELMKAFMKDLDVDMSLYPYGTFSDYLFFDYIPEEITDSKSANWNPIDIPGRSEPIMGYTSSSSRELSLHLMFVAGVGQSTTPSSFHVANASEDGVRPEPDSAVGVKVKVDWLKSLVNPDYSNPNVVKPPHRILLSIGRLIKSICIVSTVNVLYRSPWDEYLLPYIAEVDLSLLEVNKVPPGFSDVRLGLYTGDNSSSF